MNVYFVGSEKLCDDSGVPEYYHIAFLVLAHSRGQAKYIAYKKDRPYGWPSIEDMPRFTVRKLGEVVDDGEPRVVGDESGAGADRHYVSYWNTVDAKDISVPAPSGRGAQTGITFRSGGEA
jgi:hypothetical protein